MSAAGKPSPDSPAAIARELGISVPGGHLSWDALTDWAFARYWQVRSTPISGPSSVGKRAAGRTQGAA